MPAIQLARLRQQTEKLASLFTSPQACARELAHLFEYYADRTHRPSQRGAPPPVLMTYKIAQPVMRQISASLAPQAAHDTQAAFALADTLWAEKKFEFRLLATELLGHTRPADPSSLAKHILAWNDENEEDQLQEKLAGESLAYIRRNARQYFLEQMEAWLLSPNKKTAALGLIALKNDLAEAHFEDIPAYYRLLKPLATNPEKYMMPYLLNLVKPLARRSPRETAFFLRQCLESGHNKLTARLLRNSLTAFPDELQQSLKSMLKTTYIAE